MDSNFCFNTGKLEWDLLSIVLDIITSVLNVIVPTGAQFFQLF